MYEFLEKHRSDLSRCMRCGLCQAVCPTYQNTREESMVARGRISLIEALMENKLGLTRKLADKLESCLGCQTCTENCPTGVDPVRLIKAAKEEFFKEKGVEEISYLVLSEGLKRGWPLNPLSKITGWGLRHIYPNLPESISPFTFNQNKKMLPIPAKNNLRKTLPPVISVPNPVMRVAFFTGCLIDFIYPESGRGVIDILTKNRVEVIIPETQLCCGLPCASAGDRENTLFLAKKNLNTFKDLSVDRIITACSSCSAMLKNEYPLLLGDDPSGFSEKVTDIHLFLKNDLNTNYEHYIREFSPKIKVTYHDPCHLKRGLGIFNEPREIIKRLPGVEFLEMPNADSCCGGAGLFGFKYYELSLKIARSKVENIRKSGADIVLTPCPSCIMHITDALHQFDLSRVRVLHPMELFSENKCSF